MKKANYCKYCGGLINEDRICTECGHKFLKIRIKNDKFITIALSISTILLIFISLDLYNNNTTIHNNNEIYKQQIENLNNDLYVLNEELSGIEDRYDTLYQSNKALNKAYDDLNSEYFWENLSLKEELEQYQRDFAYFAPRYGNCYHTWDCYYLDNAAEIKCDCINYLKNRGYVPCSYCY